MGSVKILHRLTWSLKLAFQTLVILQYYHVLYVWDVIEATREKFLFCFVECNTVMRPLHFFSYSHLHTIVLLWHLFSSLGFSSVSWSNFASRIVFITNISLTTSHICMILDPEKKPSIKWLAFFFFSSRSGYFPVDR